MVPYPLSGPTDVRGAARLTKLYKIMSENAPPSISDILARHVARALESEYAQPVKLSRKPGGNMTAGITYASGATPDGHTLLLGSNGSVVINPQFFPQGTTRADRDLVPVAPLATMTFVLTAHPSLPAESLPELLRWLRQRPGQVYFSSSGDGSTGHLAGELLKRLTRIDIVHAPFNGGYAALNGMVTGQVRLSSVALPAVLPFRESDRFTVIAQSGRQRHPRLADVPTFAEGGVPEFEVEAWFGVFTRAGAPQRVIDGLNAVIGRSLEPVSFAQHLRANGLEVYNATADVFSGRIRADASRWAETIRVSTTRPVVRGPAAGS